MNKISEIKDKLTGEVILTQPDESKQPRWAMSDVDSLFHSPADVQAMLGAAVVYMAASVGIESTPYETCSQLQGMWNPCAELRPNAEARCEE